MIYERIIGRRTIRKYLQDEVPREVLTRCVDAARLSPCGSNLQGLKYLVIDEPDLLEQVFATLKWAAYLPGYSHEQTQKPKAYIVILLDRAIRKDPGHDAGIAAMSISLVAHDQGLGSCILGSVDRDKLRIALNIPSGLEIVLVVSLGYPAERSLAEAMKDDDVKYWLDDSGTLHVPKRPLESILRWNRFP